MYIYLLLPGLVQYSKYIPPVSAEQQAENIIRKTANLLFLLGKAE